MGLFSGLRNSVKAVSGMVAEVKAANEAAAAQPVPILNPTPQDEVDRLIAAGGTARGVVLGRSHQTLEAGERVRSMSVEVRVLSRLAGGEFGGLARLKIRTSSDVAGLLQAGLEIPIVLDRATGLATAIPTAELMQELESRLAEASKGSGWGLDPSLQGMIETAQWTKGKITGKDGGAQK